MGGVNCEMLCYNVRMVVWCGRDERNVCRWEESIVRCCVIMKSLILESMRVMCMEYNHVWKY